MPIAWRDILTRLLEKDPAHRYASYQALRDDLEGLKPRGSTPAGFPVRLLAYGIDQAGLLMPTLGLAYVLYRYRVDPFDQTTAYYVTPVISALLMLVPLVLLAFIWWDIRTPGRWLSQLRVVDSFGLPLGRSQRVIREFLRNIPLWMVIFSIVLFVNFRSEFMYINIVTGMFILADLASMFVGSQRRTLHDYTCESKVVLASSS